ncbi:MAG: hypothetical protein RLZZ470_597 [Pseudomonadota bacterium]
MHWLKALFCRQVTIHGRFCLHRVMTMMSLFFMNPIMRFCFQLMRCGKTVSVWCFLSSWVVSDLKMLRPRLICWLH